MSDNHLTFLLRLKRFNCSQATEDNKLKESPALVGLSHLCSNNLS